MSNLEYLIWILENNEELVEQINSMESEYIPELANSVCESIDTYYEFYEDNYDN